jgi:penicillin-insensitive murein endopeptidase
LFKPRSPRRLKPAQLSANLRAVLFLGMGALAVLSTRSSAPVQAESQTVAKTTDDGHQPESQTPPQPVTAAVPGTPVSGPVPPSQGGLDSVTRVAVTPPPAAAGTPAPALTKTPAKDLFSAVKEPAKMAARSVGFYSKGCLAGGQELPVTGPAWQAMRLSRNRNWGNPVLVKFIERFAEDAKEKDGWPGLLIGDMSQPRGGPLPFGHASHQIGLDVDIWYKPMPDRELSAKERDDIPMESFLSDPAHVNPQMWKPGYVKLLRRASSYPQVARIFVHPAIKKWLCENAGSDRDFLHKIQPIYGHDDHFHVRLACPAGQADCRNQVPLPNDDGCGKNLDHWIALLSKPAPTPIRIAPTTAVKPIKGKPALLLKQLPPDCRTVLTAAPAAVSQVADKTAK